MAKKRVKLVDLIEAGIISSPFSIHARFKGELFNATVDKDGFIIFSGKRYTSLSIAGGIVRASISGKPADGLDYRRVNGWSFWKFFDATKTERPIDDLRRIYEENRRDRHKK